MEIPLSAPDITESEIAAVTAVLRSTQLSLGAKLVEFERAVADYTGTPYAVAVNSGTSGLHLCVRALDLKEGDEVIVPSFTFIAAANAIVYERATPVFVDISPGTLNLDPVKVEAAITPRTRAIMVVHTFGRPAPMKEILAIAEAHRLVVIEDACEAIGAEYEGRKVGSFGRAGVFAFYPNKQITTGEGGIVVTHDESLATLFRSLRNQGRDAGGDWFDHTELGYNYRLPEMSCALGIAQLERIEVILEQREAVARAYTRRLAGCSDIVLPSHDIADGRISWFVYVVQLGDDFTQADRDRIVTEMRARGIGCGRYFAPIHLQPCYRDLRTHRPTVLPQTERIAARTIALPFFNSISEKQIEFVCEELIGLLTRWRN